MKQITKTHPLHSQTLLITFLFSLLTITIQTRTSSYSYSYSHKVSDQCCTFKKGIVCGKFFKDCCRSSCTSGILGSQWCQQGDQYQPDCQTCTDLCKNKGGIPCGVVMATGKIQCCARSDCVIGGSGSRQAMWDMANDIKGEVQNNVIHQQRHYVDTAATTTTTTVSTTTVPSSTSTPVTPSAPASTTTSTTISTTTTPSSSTSSSSSSPLDILSLSGLGGYLTPDYYMKLIDQSTASGKCKPNTTITISSNCVQDSIGNLLVQKLLGWTWS